MTDPYKPKAKTPPKAFLVGNAAFLKYPGVIHLDKLKQVVDADQQDLIKPADFEIFLKVYFTDGTKGMMDFKTNLDRLFSAIGGKIMEMVANPVAQSKSETHLQEPVIYSTKDISDILGVQKQTVINWVNNGWLIAEQNVEAGKFHIQESNLLAFLESSSGKKYKRIWNAKRSIK